MFPFDQAALPQLTTRKALVIVDFQNDFIGSDEKPLSVTEPTGFVNRTLELASIFRLQGDVVWVQSCFDKPRVVDGDQIIVSDDDAVGSHQTTSRVRRIIPTEKVDEQFFLGAIDPEAFLSHDEPLCVKRSDAGFDMPSNVKQVMHESDMVLTKSHYSAFLNTHLLRLLRAKMVMEVFICGSLANVGVFATAVDAAGHGMSITVVEDCCGYRSELRQQKAVKMLVDLTGCEIASSGEVIAAICPTQAPPPVPAEPPQNLPVISGDRTLDDSEGDKNDKRASLSPDIVRPLTGLRLASDSPAPATIVSEASRLVPYGDAKRDNSQEGGLQGETSYVKTNTSRTPKKAVGGFMSPISSNTKPMSSPKKHEHRQPDISNGGPGGLPASQSDSTNGDNSYSHSPPNEMPSTPPEMETQLNNDLDNEDSPLGQVGLCEGDTDIIKDAVSPRLAQVAFERLKREVCWHRMSHQGGEVPRLVAVQGDIAGDGSIPVYRHPADESPPLLPFSPTALAIKAEIESHLGHQVNHVLIQFYRDGNDYISEHSDKTLDIVKGSYIANVSLGAERTMVLRTKRMHKNLSRETTVAMSPRRKIQRARLSHNSLCRMGLRTNMRWLHAIRQDKRADRDKSAADLAFSGGRISLTFRKIGTFLDEDESVIWGQGATGKTRDTAHAIINGQSPEATKMLQAFGAENHSSNFDWDVHYGNGFDVLHLRNSPRFFVSGDFVVNLRIKLMLVEYGIRYSKGSMTLTNGSDSGTESGLSRLKVLPIKFIDNDAGKSTTEGDVAIMLYLHSCYGRAREVHADAAVSHKELARCFTLFQQGLVFLNHWRSIQDDAKGEQDSIPKSLTQELMTWDAHFSRRNGDADSPFIGGKTLLLPDFALWPVLHSIVDKFGLKIFDNLDNLGDYYKNVLRLESTMLALDKVADHSSQVCDDKL